MSKPSAKIILDSVSPLGQRLTTAELKMHRFMLPEFNTHRMFSRNSASTRAIPLHKQLEALKAEPAFPVAWLCEQAGMQGGAELTGDDLYDAMELFENAHRDIVERVETYLENHPDKSSRLHKSAVGRLLEPFMWHKVIVTSTDFDNFFEQRCSPLAQPEIEVVANLLRDALLDSTPQDVFWDEWHLPYVTGIEDPDLPLETKKAVSAARCARVSYLTHDGRKSIEDDLILFGKLKGAEPPHFSPFEHQAKPAIPGVYNKGNFDGWTQFRTELEKGYVK